VRERDEQELNRETGNIEIIANEITIILNTAKPLLTIEDETDGGDELRMQRTATAWRNPLQENIIFPLQTCSSCACLPGGKDFFGDRDAFLIKSGLRRAPQTL
jgi:aspartyl-tRNA synthetase